MKREVTSEIPVDLDAASTLAIAIVNSTKHEDAAMATTALVLAAEAIIGTISSRPWASLRSAIDLLEKITATEPHERVSVPVTGDQPS